MDRKNRHLRRPTALLLMLGCTHSDTFVTPLSSVGPSGAGPDIQLTFNVDADYWPTWTQDGRGILYAFVNPENRDHRCLGLLPPTGGTRIWELCDNRAVRRDSSSSFAAYALDSTGRLLIAEAVSSNAPGIPLPRTTLWIADTASPYVRTALLTLPLTVGNTSVTWLSDIAWTGSNTFIALGQQFNTVPHCVTAPLPPTFTVATQCLTRDTIFADAGGVVLRGTIAGSNATLQAVAGTVGATSYSLAENGASIVFTLLHQVQLFKVPATGGTPVPTPSAVPNPTSELLGVSCKAATCIAAKDGLTYRGGFSFLPDFATPTRPMELHRVSLNDGADQVLQSNMSNIIFATPRISPVSGDVVVQVGASWGHLQTFGTRALPSLWDADGNSVLHLYTALVP